MDESTANKLAEINELFYTRFGREFAETRRRIQPGVARVLANHVSDGNWLDLGCGSGALGCMWIEHGVRGLYEGLDFSPVLIAEAQKTVCEKKPCPNQEFIYTQADLSRPGWTSRCSLKVYNGILMFAALHHIPAADRRLAFVKEMAGLLETRGQFILSVWQFQRSQKLMTHVQQWSTVGIDPAELDEGDTLLDWRHTSPGHPDEKGLRYVHLFSKDELSALAEETGFVITNCFDSDGAGGNLSLYQVWQRKSAHIS
jgi:SAM-dependent methyltransferase